MPEKILLTHACFAPVEYFALINAVPVEIEKYSNYVRQTYRNRYIILGANRPLTLSVPVEKVKGKKIKDSDIKIAYHTQWQNNHWHSIVSAYNSSPFFQFYRDDIEPFFSKKYKFLFDFNIEITNLMIDLLDVDANITFTGEYRTFTGNKENDMREVIHPKKNNSPFFKPFTYKQVFDDRHGFVPNLSILDLLFNKGPESQFVLKKSTTIKNPKA
ncbi:MAG: WbqC family protein [bacterium]